MNSTIDIKCDIFTADLRHNFLFLFRFASAAMAAFVLFFFLCAMCLAYEECENTIC